MRPLPSTCALLIKRTLNPPPYEDDAAQVHEGYCLISTAQTGRVDLHDLSANFPITAFFFLSAIARTTHAITVFFAHQRNVATRRSNGSTGSLLALFCSRLQDMWTRRQGRSCNRVFTCVIPETKSSYKTSRSYLRTSLHTKDALKQ